MVARLPWPCMGSAGGSSRCLVTMRVTVRCRSVLLCVGGERARGGVIGLTMNMPMFMLGLYFFDWMSDFFQIKVIRTRFLSGFFDVHTYSMVEVFIYF